MIDKDTLKNELTIDQVFGLVAELGGDPHMNNGSFVSRTICHGGDSHKLYYYNNTHLFKCYTQCPEDSFDIYQLVMKVKSRESNEEWLLPRAINYVARYFGYELYNDDFSDLQEKLPDWEIFNNYSRIKSINDKQIVELKTYPEKILQYLPTPRITPWEQEHIDTEVMKYHGIKYDPVAQGIVIPHYDIDGNLIGIRERTMVKEEEADGKYRPAIINGIMYNHPLGFNLYNLNNSKEAIKIIHKAIVFESEKSTLLYASYFGKDNDISVACCGSNFISYQANLLLSLGVTEIVIAFDRQYQEIGDKDFKRWTHKLETINEKYKGLCQMSFIFDTQHRLEYKASPIDQGPELFLELFQERIFL